MARRNKSSNWLKFGSLIDLLAAATIYDELLDSEYGDHLYSYGRWARLVVGVLMTLLWLMFMARKFPQPLQ